MDKTDILKLLKKGERVNLECKQAQMGIPNSLWETYSAFANTYGGTILLGIHENLEEKRPSKRYTILGVENPLQMIKNIWNTINNEEKVSLNLLKDEDIEVVDVDGKSVISIKVPRADYSQKPICINNNPFNGSFWRGHEGDYHCPKPMVRMMVRDTFEDGNDGIVLKGYGMKDVDIPTLTKYRRRFDSRNPDHVWEHYSDQDFLIQLGGYGYNEEEGFEGLTVAGLLMFGKGLPINTRFAALRLDYLDKTNLIGDQRYSDRLTDDGRWENNLFNFMTMVLPKLTLDLPRPFRMEGMVRIDDTPQHKAVREAFTNMIIHGDLLLEGQLRVEKYDDRFVLTNPGLLKLPVEKIYKGGESKSRNIRMQKMLRMIGFGENIGSGFPLILSAWQEKHWIKPELIEEPDLLQVKLILHIIDKHTADQKNAPIELTARQKAILNIIRKDNDITREELAIKLKLSLASIRREIDTLRASGILDRGGANKDGYWIVNSDL